MQIQIVEYAILERFCRILSSMVGANGLVVVPEGTTGVSAGEEVAIMLIGPLA